MIDNLFNSSPNIGPVTVYGTAKQEFGVTQATGWFYPLFLTRKEAINLDIDKGGKGIYRTIKFFNREGEFYFADTYNTLAAVSDPQTFDVYYGAGAESPFFKIQNRLSLLVENQLPDFIQSEYTMFVTFIKAYYEFLEQDYGAQEVLHNIGNYSDIDQTSEELVSRFFENYANELTKSDVANNRLLIKKIREIYSKKGTETAYRILFNVLYQETIEFLYPYDLVLKPSSGKWVIPYRLRVKPSDISDNFDFKNTEVTGLSNGATAIVSDVIKIDEHGFIIYELILDPTSIKGTFGEGEYITASKIDNLTGTNSVTSVIGQLYSVVSRIDVIDGKLGYRKGTNIPINDALVYGKYAKASIQEVNRYGSIVSVQIDNPGLNYSNNFSSLTIPDPTEKLYGTYEFYDRQVTITFPNKHGIEKGTTVYVKYTSNILADANIAYNAQITSIPSTRSIRFPHQTATI